MIAAADSARTCGTCALVLPYPHVGDTTAHAFPPLCPKLSGALSHLSLSTMAGDPMNPADPAKATRPTAKKKGTKKPRSELTPAEVAKLNAPEGVDAVSLARKSGGLRKVYTEIEKLKLQAGA